MDKEELTEKIQDAKTLLRPKAKYVGTVDETVFPKLIVLKTAYVFFDKCHFLFRKIDDAQIEVTCVAKDHAINPERVFLDFSNELTNTLLRESIAESERVNRELIFSGVMGASIPNETNSLRNSDQTVPVEPKDIEEILKGIELELGLNPTNRDS